MRLALSLLLTGGMLRAQDDQEKQPEAVPKEKLIYVVGEFNPKEAHDVPYSVSKSSLRDTQLRRMSRTTVQAMKEYPNVSTQETGPSQGSPFIRGLTSYHTVMLIDGIRLNHSGMRAGPNQYWGTVDAFMIDSLELVRGPASVLYGSDAIGGTVSARTIEPYFDEEGHGLHSRTYGRYSSAERSYIARQEFSGNVGDFGWIVGGTYKDFNDIVGGRHTGEMNNTGYDEYDADLKLVYRTGEDSKLILAAQHHRLDDGNRWHSTLDATSWHGTTTGSNIYRHFDQERNLYYLQYHWAGEGLVDAFRFSASVHEQAEKTDRLRTATRREVREFDIVTPAVWTQAGKKTDLGYFTGGIEYYHDIVSSEGHDWNPGLIPFTRGIIADDAEYSSLGLFLQDEFSIGRLDVTPGVRFSYVSYEADEVDPVVGGSVIVDSLDDDFTAVTGSLRLLYHVDDNWNALAGWGMGFRAPSLHDLTSTDLVLSGSLETPAPDLEPEYAHTIDGGFRARYDTWEVTAIAFYTWLDDFMGRVPIGDISVPPDGVVDFSRDNFSEGWIYGFEVMALYRFTPEVTAWFNWGYSKGRKDTLGGGDEPLSKMNPSLAHFGLRFQPKAAPAWVEGVVSFADEQSHQSAADQGDTQRQPFGGTPGYTVYGIRAGYVVNENLEVSAAVDNITNKDYRIHGSGQNMPGTNFILAADLQF